MLPQFEEFLTNQLEELKSEGLYKAERTITSSQSSSITVQENLEVINLCANNYLGLANNKEVIKHAQAALENYGYGMASVRFICGTQTPHHELETKLSLFLKKQATILYSSCFDANTGLFETLLSSEDAIISDALNHASIIDGVRLCKAQRFRYKNNDMTSLKEQLEAAKNCRFKLIVTDGVFSMDGTFANLPDICDLARKYQALVMVDDSHAVGFIGKNGRGSAELFNVEDSVDIVTGTLGKALGGASGGYTSSTKLIVAWLRQRSRPYLFSNSLAPVIAKASSFVLELIEKNNALREKLQGNSDYFRNSLTQLGFELIPGKHPIIPVMLKDAAKATLMADKLLQEGIYVIGFSYPVVPKNAARIRTQMSAAHDIVQLDKAIAAFAKIGRELRII